MRFAISICARDGRVFVAISAFSNASSKLFSAGASASDVYPDGGVDFSPFFFSSSPKPKLGCAPFLRLLSWQSDSRMSP